MKKIPETTLAARISSGGPLRSTVYSEMLEQPINMVKPAFADV